MVLGNTFHLHLSPGEELIAERGGLNRFMGWERPIITDSGGFQVFSLAHGGVADEIKGRRGNTGGGAQVEISEEGVAFRSLLDGSSRFLGPEQSMGIQAALGWTSPSPSTSAPCPRRPRLHRPLDRANHRWLDRCLDWHSREGPADQAVFGIVQGGVHEDLRRKSAEMTAATEIDGIAIGGTLGREKEEMHGVLGFTAPLLPEEAPRHLLGIGEIDDLLVGIGMGIDLSDCAIPTRLARHGTALAPNPAGRFRIDLTKASYAGDDSPVVEGCPCEACTRPARADLHYLARNKDLTGTRLLTLHNLSYMEALMREVRRAIERGDFPGYARRVLGGSAPWADLDSNG